MSFSTEQLMQRGALIGDAASTKPAYPVGRQITDENGNVYEYVKVAKSSAITKYDLVIFLAAGAASATTTNDAAGARCGFATVAVTSDASNYQYIWCLVKTGAGQVTSVRVALNCAAATTLQTTATAGVMDDAETIPVYGVTLGTAQTTAGTNATASVSFPWIADVAAFS